MTLRPMLKPILYLLTSTLMLASCSVAKQVPYFQDIVSDSTLAIMPEPATIRLRPQDKISILVNSRDPQLMTLFNLPVIQRYIGGNVPMGTNNNTLAGYTLDMNGDVDFPVIGKIHLAGMTREEAAEYVKQELISNNLIKDPVVTVEFMNLTISVMGEVNKPGRYNIDKDQITIFLILEAIRTFRPYDIAFQYDAFLHTVLLRGRSRLFAAACRDARPYLRHIRNPLL